MSKTLKLCLAGFGNAAQEFCRMLIEKHDEILESEAFDIKVCAIATKSKGALINENGIDLNKALHDVLEMKSFDKNDKDFSQDNTIDIIKSSEADILIELSTLSIKDGQPAISHIETAFNNGMHVITANKGPIAWAYNRLSAMADEKKLGFLYETTVMDGAPIYNMVREVLPGCKVLAFKGILNSTTNFILEEMENGSTFESSIKEAQKGGFAEADPSMDIDGWDAAAKTTALLNVFMNANLTPFDIKREGISHISYDMINDLKIKGLKIKLLCEGYYENGKPVGIVHPVQIPQNDIFSNIDATSSILSITTDLMGELCMVERNPEIRQTAYGIYSDLLTLIKKLKS